MRGLLIGLGLVISQAAIAAGPTGLGGIKLGATQAEIETLSAGSPVRLADGLRPYEYKKEEPTPGVDKYTASILMDGVDSPMKSTLSFRAGKLESVSFAIDKERTFDKFKDQIGSKYGDPKVIDKTKEEQCVYKNGNSFKLKWGALENVWEGDESGRAVSARLSSFAMGGCPVNLRYDAVGATFYSMRIYFSDTEAKKDVGVF